MDSIVSREHSINTPFLTIGLSVLNGGALLETAIRSIVKQSYESWELLIIDDGSTDGFIDTLSSLIDPRIIIVRDGFNKGLSARLNQAVMMARGKYFARMDHDDICHPERFTRQISFLEDHPEVDLLATRCVTINEQDQLIGSLPSPINHADICRHPWQGFYMAHPSWMGKTEWFRNNSYRDPAPYCCEDQELLLRTHYLSRFHTLPDFLLAYRIRNYTKWQKRFRTRIEMAKFQLNHFLRRGSFINALLSIFITFIRVCCDALTNFFYSASPQTKADSDVLFSSNEYEEWRRLIKSLKASVLRLSDEKSNDAKA
jgi:glycosyltransferase involved in cell wall biosynthesis